MPDDRPTKKVSLEDFDIETIGLDKAIEGREGLDVNHASRLRMQFLTAQHASLVTQIQFADAKAAALMTLMGLIALNGPVKIAQTRPDDYLAIAVFFLMMATIGLAMTSIIPRYPDRALNKIIKRHERFSWPALVAQGYSPLDHAMFIRRAEASQLLMSLAQTNGNMARVLRSKFRGLRLAFLLGALDLAMIVLYVLVNRDAVPL